MYSANVIFPPMRKFFFRRMNTLSRKIIQRWPPPDFFPSRGLCLRVECARRDGSSIFFPSGLLSTPFFVLHSLKNLHARAGVSLSTKIEISLLSKILPPRRNVFNVRRFSIGIFFFCRPFRRACFSAYYKRRISLYLHSKLRWQKNAHSAYPPAAATRWWKIVIIFLLVIEEMPDRYGELVVELRVHGICMYVCRIYWGVMLRPVAIFFLSLTYKYKCIGILV